MLNQPLEGLIERAATDATFLLRTYNVRVQGFHQTYPYLASTPAKARVKAWHSYCSYRAIPFGDFLKISSISRGVDQPGIGRPILVGGMPAHWCGFNGQYVSFCRPGEDQMFFSHPNDVEEVPDGSTLRAIQSSKTGDAA